jgi:hypothetical protein
VLGSRFKVDKHIVTCHFERIDRRFGVGIMTDLPGLSIEVPAMPRADDFAIFDIPLAEWAASMHTDVVEGADVPIDVGDADHRGAVRACELLGLARCGKLSG